MYACMHVGIHACMYVYLYTYLSYIMKDHAISCDWGFKGRPGTQRGARTGPKQDHTLQNRHIVVSENRGP